MLDYFMSIDTQMPEMRVVRSLTNLQGVEGMLEQDVKFVAMYMRQWASGQSGRFTATITIECGRERPQH